MLVNPMRDCIKHTLASRLHSMVVKAQDCQSHLLQLALTLCILLFTVCMTFAINFYDQSQWRAEEINNILTNWFLAHKLKSPQLSSTQMPPQNHFRKRAVLAQLASALH
jgi:hypothetical protein